MPLGTDPFIAEKTAEGIAAAIGGVVLPTLYCGTGSVLGRPLKEALGLENPDQYIYGVYGRKIPSETVKSYYSKEDIFALILREYIGQLVRHGYRLIVVVNGHGGTRHEDQINRLCEEFSNESSSRVICVFGAAGLPDLPEAEGHASLGETSMQMFINGEDVDLSQLPPKPEKLKNGDWGIIDGKTFALCPNADKTVEGDPRDATFDIGRRMIEKAILNGIQIVKDTYREISIAG